MKAADKSYRYLKSYPMELLTIYVRNYNLQ